MRQTSDSLRRRHFLLKCVWESGSVPLFSLQVTLYESRRRLIETKNGNLSRQRPLLLLRNIFALIIPCLIDAARCSFQSASTNALIPTSVSPSKPLSQIQSRHGPLPGLRFLSFIEGALFPNVNKVVKRVLLVMGVQQLEDISRGVRTNLRVCLCTFVWSGGGRQKCGKA